MTEDRIPMQQNNGWNTVEVRQLFFPEFADRTWFKLASRTLQLEQMQDIPLIKPQQHRSKHVRPRPLHAARVARLIAASVVPKL